MQSITNNIDRYIMREFGLAEGMAYKLYKQYGTAIRGLRATGYDVDDRHYLDFVHTIEDLSSQIKPNKELREMLLATKVPQFVFTASIKDHAERCLNLLEVHDILSKRTIIDSWAVGLKSKYDIRTYEDVLKIASDNLGYTVKPENAVFADDNHKNLLAAKKAGWGTTVLIGIIGRDGKPRSAGGGIDFVIDKVEELPTVLPHLW